MNEIAITSSFKFNYFVVKKLLYDTILCYKFENIVFRRLVVMYLDNFVYSMKYVHSCVIPTQRVTLIGY